MPERLENVVSSPPVVRTGYLYLISLVATMGGFIFGYDLEFLVEAELSNQARELGPH